MDPIENFPHHPQFLQSTIGSGDVMWKNHEEPQLALPEDQTISFGTSANVVWYCSCSLVCDMGFSLRKEVSSWTWGAEQKSYGGIQSAVRHSSTASSKRPRFDCISMRLVDLVGLILLGGWKEVSERCFVGKMALHQTENTFYTVVCQHLSSLSPSFKSHHLHFAECCQEFGAGIEPTPEKLYEPGSPGDSFFPLGFLTMPLAANVSDICRPEAWMTLVGSMCTWWLRDFDFDPYCLVVWNTNVIFFHINWE